MTAALPLLAHASSPLAGFFADPAVEDVAVNEAGVSWVLRRGRWERHETPDLDFQMLEGVAILAGALRGQDVGWFSPLLATEMPGPNGELLRLQVCMPPAVQPGTISLTWRRPGNDVAPLADMETRYRTGGWNRWADRGEQRARAAAEVLARYDAGDAAGFLDLAMRRRLNIWFCAATGAGKTTLFKSCMQSVGDGERIVTVEDAAELTLRQPNAVRLLISLSGVQVTGTDLITAALRMRPHRVPIQEIRTADMAWVYVNAIMTGHEGSPTTMHGRNPEEAFRRMFGFCKSAAGGTMGDEHMGRMLADAVDAIVPLRNEAGEFILGEVWFKDDAARRGETAVNLLGGA